MGGKTAVNSPISVICAGVIPRSKVFLILRQSPFLIQGRSAITPWLGLYFSVIPEFLLFQQPLFLNSCLSLTLSPTNASISQLAGLFDCLLNLSIKLAVLFLVNCFETFRVSVSVSYQLISLRSFGSFSMRASVSTASCYN